MGKLPLTKANIRKMAQERAINAMEGDIAGGGFGNWLFEQGYTVAETIQIERAYAEVIVDVQAKLDGSSKYEARTALLKRHDPMKGA